MKFSIFVVAVLLYIVYPSSLTEALRLYVFSSSSTADGLSQYVKVGCFRDEGGPPSQRALPELLANYRGGLDWYNLQQVVKDCASEAKKKKYMYFGIQFYGECWSGVTAPLTYDLYGPSSNCGNYVGKSWTNVVYRFKGEERECLNYSIFNSASRSSSFQLPKGNSPACDDKLSPGWYRFMDRAGVQMASNPLTSGKCATAVTGWLSSSHPNMDDGIVGGKVCFRWRSELCKWSQDVKVRNCGRFYVYKLKPTFACPMRFCGQN